MTNAGENERGSELAMSAEKTLRLIASLPAPDGLVERVQAGLKGAPRRARVLGWPEAVTPGAWMRSGALRTAAAAAIVCVVAGGGWQIYSRVVPAPGPNVVAMPARVGNQGGFANASAVRKPDTLTGPVVPQAAGPQTKTASQGQAANGTKHRKAKATPAISQPK
jgi:hypothetical protein